MMGVMMLVCVLYLLHDFQHDICVDVCLQTHQDALRSGLCTHMDVILGAAPVS